MRLYYNYFFLMGCSTVSDFFEDNKYYYKSGYQRVQLQVEENELKIFIQ